MRKRLPTAIVLLIIVFLTVQFLPRLWFFIVLQVIILISVVEFYNLSRNKMTFYQKFIGILLALIVGLSFYFQEISFAFASFVCLLLIGVYFLLTIDKVEKLAPFPALIALTIFGVFYLSFTLNYFYLLREERGPFSIYFLLVVIFVGDTGAYLVGKLWGSHKMVPMASPKKTWEGCIGGIIFACIGGVLAQQILYRETLIWKVIVFALMVNVIAQISDPLESLFKRSVGVKDSSNILPGHGGFLDRVDSLILTTPFFYYLLKLISID